ncbi:hypothetical protein BT69DRAFT_1325143 [Atractiella rhizophila]|nr:hypothetical protein BT69DRAFT_1325143 [Atractiella rhizophila]
MESLAVFQLVHSERNTYGIRTRDFSRYHTHCTRKVGELRKKLEIVQTTGAKRGIYKKKELEEGDPKYLDQRHALLHLFLAERAWAHAQSLPKEEAKDRHHADRLFSKSTAHASTFLSLIQSNPSYSLRTTAEAQAYTYTLEAQRYFSKAKALPALSALCKAYELLQVLSKWNEEEKGSDVADSISLAIERLDELEVMIRFCNHQLQPGSNVDAAAIVAAERKREPDGELDALLRRANEAATAAAVTRPAITTHKSVFRGLEISVRNVEVSRALLATDKALEELGKEKERPGGKKRMGAKRMAEFDKCLSTLGEAEGKAERVVKDGQSQGNSSLELAHSYISYKLLTTRILRDSLLLQDALSKLSDKTARLTTTSYSRQAAQSTSLSGQSNLNPSISKKRAKHTLSARIDKASLKVYPVLIKLLSGIILSYESLRDHRIVEQDTSSASTEDGGDGITDLLGRIEAKIAEEKAVRALYLGHTYRLMEKYTESAECLARGEIYAREARRSILMSGGFSPSATSSTLPVTEATLANLETSLQEAKAKTARKWFEDGNGAELLAKLEGEGAVEKKPTFYDVARNYVASFDMEAIKEKAGVVKKEEAKNKVVEPPPKKVEEKKPTPAAIGEDRKGAQSPARGWGFFRKG